MRVNGERLLGHLGADAESVPLNLRSELAADMPVSAADVGLSERRIDQLAEHLEQQLFGAGGGNVGRTKLLASALLQRRAVQRVLGSSPEAEKRAHVREAMIEKAARVLKHLTPAGRGSRSLEDHQRFETIVAALTPDDATSEHMISIMEELLDVQHSAIERGVKRNAVAFPGKDDTCGGFSRATKISRTQRKDFRGWGRRIAIDFWHKATRLDTRLGKKKRNREVNPVTKQVFYREHWRHVQYDTDQQIAEDFFKSVDYQQYAPTQSP